MKASKQPAAPSPRVDFAKLFDDLVYLGMTGQPLAHRLGMSMTQLQRAEKGQPPGALQIEHLVRLWCELTGKPRAFVPMTTAAAKSRTPTPGLASDEEREPSFLALQAAFMVWGQQPR